MGTELQKFVNPRGYWSYEGGFSVELTNAADKTVAPKSVKFDGNTARISNGRIKQTIGGIQLHSEQEPFYWGYSFIKVIRDGTGTPLWVNYDYR